MPRIDLLLLTNHAEVSDNLLYVIGGGWNRHTRIPLPDGTMPISHFGIAVGIAFDPDDTGHVGMWFQIKSEAGEEIIRGQGDMNITQGTAPITRLALSVINLNVRWPRAGIYHLTAGIVPTDLPEKQFAFVVEDQQST